MSIYKLYSNRIKNSIKNGILRGEKGIITKSNTPNRFASFNGEDTSSIGWINEIQEKALFDSINGLSSILGKKVKDYEKPGAHPSFTNIENENDVEYHRIISMFIDIKNSTALFRKYNPYSVADITTTIQKAAIHTAWYFDGYIHRFHGDGLLIYFGDRNRPIEEATRNALMMASFFSYFVAEDLNEIFEEQNFDKIYTRIGIDLGYDEEVLWHKAGMGKCSEITTCSLHTSLASKMQSNADSNGIMVGDNIRTEFLKVDSLMDVFSIKKDKNSKDEFVEDRYVFQIPDENYHYTQWKFDWRKYLKSIPTIENNGNGKFSFKSQPIKNLNYGFLQKQTENYRPYISYRG